MREESRQTLWFWFWVIMALMIIFLLAGLIFASAGFKRGQEYKEMDSVAQRKTPIVRVQKRYHLSRTVNSSAVYGQDRKGHGYYLIYLPASKRAYLYAAAKGRSAKQIMRKFYQEEGHKRQEQINLGWYKGQPAWEVSFVNANSSRGYALYSFKKGHRLSFINNL
ncbi:MAG: hypothetical protein ACFN0Y_00670 [Lactobacillus sp.]